MYTRPIKNMSAHRRGFADNPSWRVEKLEISEIQTLRVAINFVEVSPEINSKRLQRLLRTCKSRMSAREVLSVSTYCVLKLNLIPITIYKINII